MPIESIQTVKAPKDWNMNSDQRRQVQQDRRLQRMSRDDLYNYFNKPPIQGPRTQQRRGSNPPPKSDGGPASGLFGWVDTITNALRGR